MSILLTDGSEYGFNLADLAQQHAVALTGPTGPPGAAATVSTDLIWHKMGELEGKIQLLQNQMAPKATPSEAMPTITKEEEEAAEEWA